MFFFFSGIANFTPSGSAGTPVFGLKVEGEDGPAKTIVFANSKFMATWVITGDTTLRAVPKEDIQRP